VTEFKYLGTNLTKRNYIQEEVKSRLKWGNACYHSVQNLLSSSSLSNNIKIKIHKIIILSVVLYGCKTWSLMLREKGRLRVFENRMLRWIFGPKRDEVTGGWRKLRNEELNDLYCSPNIVSGDKIEKNEMDGACNVYVGRGDAYTRLLGKPQGKETTWEIQV
jgi:hypothetical protein